MIRYRIPSALFDAKGIANPHQLAKQADIAYATAREIMSGDQAALGRVDVALLERIAEVLGVVDPLTLLEHVVELPVAGQQ